jgi:hypothetical protein
MQACQWEKSATTLKLVLPAESQETHNWMPPCTSGDLRELACEISEQWLLSNNLYGTLCTEQSGQSRLQWMGKTQGSQFSAQLGTHSQSKFPLTAFRLPTYQSLPL